MIVLVAVKRDGVGADFRVERRVEPGQPAAEPDDHLGDGDGLELDGGGYVRVRAAPEPVLEIEAADRAGLLRIAWHLGNRHLPLQVAGERLRIRADHVIAEMIVGLGARLTRLDAPFDPEIGAYAGAAHAHEHER